jgi:outer membrane protein insertion porin family
MGLILRAKLAAAALAMLALTAIGGQALAQNVVVEGNSRVDTETVRSYVSGSGSPEEARRSLLQTGLFSDVRVSHRGGTTVVSVRENNSINRVVFEGNKKITKENLLPEVQAKARGPFNQSVVDADVARLKEIYRRAGRADATVSARIVDLPNGRVDVVYTIDEGSKTGIYEIRFVGNNVYSARRLSGLMQSGEMNLLSFLKTNDVYDPDKIAADQELIRRFYLKNGYADFQITNTDVQYDPQNKGYVITISMNEGEQYRVGQVGFESRAAGVDPAVLRDQVQTTAGEVYNAELVERTLTGVTTEAVRRGYPFVTVRPTGQRDPASRTVSIGYVVEEGPRVYIERINVRGNSRTRDYVVRRELDVGEGDPYNRVLLDRAERRLNSLGYFKKVRVSTEPGTSVDRVVVNIDVEDQPTGAFSISGGYSTADGAIGEVSVSESNFLGRGQYVRLAAQLGERANGVDFSFTEPYFLGYRLAAGFDLFSKYSDQTQYARYENRTTGGQLRVGLPITENAGVTLRYSLYAQELKVPNTDQKPFNDCTVRLASTGSPSTDPAVYDPCLINGEASVAVKESRGTTLTSLAGVTLAYNSVDNLKNPHSGIYAEVKPDVAGLGGDSKYFRVTGEARYYKELYEDIVGVLKVQGGHIEATGKNQSSSGISTFGGDLRLVDHFFMGPTLVRGFAPSGIGPRDISTLDANSNALGGTTYYGGTAEAQFPIPFVPRDLGLKGAVFADAGTLFGYKGPRGFDVNGNGTFDGNGTSSCAGAPKAGVGVLTAQAECVTVHDKNVIRSSVGASLLWASPLGPIRFDYAFALSKDNGVVVNGTRIGQDQTQAFRFSGGTRF